MKWDGAWIAALLGGLISLDSAKGADRTEIATSALEFGGSMGKLLWVAVQTSSDTTGKPDAYVQLATRVKDQVEIGRASSSLVKSNWNVIGTTLAYAAAVDPEPLSKAITGVAAWGAKKTGDALGDFVLKNSEEQARAVLAEGLKNSGLSQADLQRLSPTDLANKVADLKVGGQKIGEILKDDPKSLAILQAHATDLALDMGVVALAKSDGTAKDVKTLRAELAKSRQAIDDYQSAVNEHLDKIDARIGTLEDATTLANAKLDKLQMQVQGDSKAIRTLAQVSYSGWTTDQKLQAVQSGLFGDITQAQKDALVESLKADKAREQAVAAVQEAAKDFGNLATIAANIGLPKDLVTGLSGAQIVATGVAKFATGDVLGGVASLTSIVGLGAPDAAAERYAAMMKYLEQQFAIVNQKLDKIIDLQVQTLKAIATLANQQQQFRREVLGQLDRIENTVLTSEQVLQAILLKDWTECYGLINGTLLNGQFAIPTQQVLVGLVGDPNIGTYAGSCYNRMTGFLDAWVKPASWSGQVIAAANFPQDVIAPNAALLSGWKTFAAQRDRAFTTARDFVLSALPDASNAPAAHLARLSQPVVDANFSASLAAAMGRPEISQRWSTFRCDQTDVLSSGLKDLICFGRLEGAALPPKSTRWGELLGASLLGPQWIRLIDTGIAVASLVSFAQRTDSGTFDFEQAQVIADFWKNGPTPKLRTALAQQSGLRLLYRLRWLTEAAVLQESVSYGDYTAELIEKTLYDPASHSLRTDTKGLTPQQQQLVSLSAQALQWNPILARNVVVLAMRHAMADALGGYDKAAAVRYHANYYGLALQDFSGPQACGNSTLAHEKLTELLPNWNFQYVVTSDQKKGDPALASCPSEFQPDPNSPGPTPQLRGAGVATIVGDIYVLVPTPAALASGAYDQSDSLRLALAYRDRLSQAIVDRTVNSTVRALAGGGSVGKTKAGQMALGLLNEGWGWTVRTKSP